MKAVCIPILIAVLAAVACSRRPGQHNRGLSHEDMFDMVADHGHRRHHDDSHESYHGYHGYHGYYPRRVHHIHKHYDKSSSEEDDDKSTDDKSTDSDKIYKFQVGDNFGAYEYLDEEGYLRGFYVDLLLAVCKKAGKKCAYLLDSYDHCWRTSGEREYPGIGIMDGWYDGCIGMLPSPDRLNTFNFTVAFTPNVKAALHWRANEDVGDKQNLTGRKIGFIEGWAVSQRCLKRQYNTPDTNKFAAVTFQTHEELVTALLRHEVDAILTADVFDSSKLGIVPQEPWFQCTLRGLSVMTHYFSDVITWWNEAFAGIQRNGDYRRLCEEARKKHGHRGEVNCI